MKALKPILFGITGVGILLFGLSFAVDSLASARWYFLLAALAAVSFAPDSRVTRAAFGTGALAAIIFFLTQLISGTPVGSKNIDLTEDDRYTLTEGTRAILSELTEPVTINYYVTRDVDGTPAEFKRHIPRVDAFLREIQSLANKDLITLNFIDPEPNTDEEDAARLDQVQQVDVTQDDKFTFGASISSLDQKTVIPFFDPGNETQLEFDVISAIAEVSQRDAATIGVMSAHTLSAGGQSGRGWLFYQMLQRSYDVADLTMSATGLLTNIYTARDWGDAPTYLDPEKFKAILVVHPAGISPEAEFALDQYILRGGTVIACVDSFSMMAAQSAQQQQQQIPGMPPQGGTPTDSTLPKLFAKHQIKLAAGDILVDRKYAHKQNPSVMILDENAMPVKDDISLAGLQNLAFLASGAFFSEPGQSFGPGLKVTRLVESSYNYTAVPAQTLTTRQGAQQLRFALASNGSSDVRGAFVLHLSGNFETAFPEGDPSAPKAEQPVEEKAEDKKEKEKPSGLANATASGNLYLIADSDLLADGMAYQFQRFGNSGFTQVVSGNGPFLMNLLDQAAGSKHLVGSRARTPVYRTFTVLADMEAEFEKTSGEKIKQFQKQADDASKEFAQIRSQMTQNNAAQYTPELIAKRDELLKIQTDASKAIRQEEKNYQAGVDSIKAGIFWKNLIIVPLSIIAIGLGIFAFRKLSTNAR